MFSDAAMRSLLSLPDRRSRGSASACWASLVSIGVVGGRNSLSLSGAGGSWTATGADSIGAASSGGSSALAFLARGFLVLALGIQSVQFRFQFQFQFQFCR